MMTKQQKLRATERILEVMDTLREKCPWDREQTFESLRNNTIEETYELVDAITDSNMDGIKEELGDLLLHVVFYSKLGEEQGKFDFADVADAECDKLIYRHPHVYGDSVAESSGDVVKSWEQLKLKEKDGNKTLLSGVPASLPSLIKAYRIQDKARNVGFDWEKKEDVWNKVKEEIEEYQAEIDKMDQEKATDEFGDLLFSLINAARLYHINPDNALERTNQKFIRRFNYVEQQTLKQERSLKDMTLEDMDSLWNEAKKQGL